MAIASIKNAVPSSEKGIPKMGPACFINSGHKSPSSKESIVPETAPVVNRIATPLLQAFVNPLYTSFFVLRYFQCANAIKKGITMPTHEKRM